MFRGKYVPQYQAPVKRHKFRPLVLFLAMVLVTCCVAGGTVAWLIADTDPVVNTFTYGDINLKLDETKLNDNGNPVDADGNPVDQDGDGIPEGIPAKTTAGNDYEMTPGKEYLKDPAVTVLAGNEACWLFVKLEESGGVTINDGAGGQTVYDFDDYLDYAVADDWIPLTDASGAVKEGIYFRYVDEDTDGLEASYQVLKDDKITVLPAVTKDMLNLLDNNGQNKDQATYPRLSITAYAVQYSGFEAEVSEGAIEPTTEQLTAAALLAWQAVEEQNSAANP